MSTETKLVLDYSSLATAAACPRKFKHKYIDYLESPEKPVPMHAGSAMHAALHALYTDVWDLEVAIYAMREAWGDFRTPPGSKHGYLTLGHLEIILADYMETRDPTELGQVKSAAQYAEKAVVFDWPDADGNLLRLGGMLDMTAEISGQKFIIDNKCTTGWLNDYWALNFKIGHQFRIYAAAMQVLTGEVYDGVYINGVYIGQPPKSGWKNVKSVPSKLFGPFYFTPAHLAETRAWAQTWANSIEMWKATGHFPQNERACGDYGGCPFMDLCDKPAELVKNAHARRNFVRRKDFGVLVSGADADRRAA